MNQGLGTGALHIVILAAGEGKRMPSSLPKVLQPLAEQSMLAHLLATARSLRPEAIHLVYGAHGAQVRAAFAGHGDINWVHQERPLGTGHAVAQALPHVPDAAWVLVLFADAPLVSAETLQALLSAARMGCRPALLTDQVADPTGYGRVLCDVRGDVRAVVEERDADEAQRRITLVNTGVLAALASALKRWLPQLGNRNAQGEYYLTDVFACAAQENNSAACVACLEPGEAEGANDFWQLAQLERRLQRRRVRAACLQGARVRDPARVDIRGALTVAAGVEIDVDVVFEGEVHLGPNVRIGPYTRLRDVVLGEGTVVEAHCDLDGVRDQGGSHIGPYARLRPGTRLDAEVRIGNFVETKNTRLGRGSKANHLSYLGDTQLGAGVNVGAGTITCNYDGVHKHATAIGDGAFIGSNSALVAPVQVGAGATVGAGSVITQDVPAGHLAVARPKQRNIAGWKGPRRKA